MAGSDEHVEPLTPVGKFDFSTTHWSVVLAANQNDSLAARDALAKLCQTYWYPLYAYVRRRGYCREDAEDLTQGFFATVLQKNYLNRADRQRGKFRTFLLSSLDNFLNNEWDRAKAKKRGGGWQIVSWEDVNAEERYVN